jgi:CHAT domain-containing protein
MCVVQSNIGEYKKAMASCNQALALRRSLDDRPRRGHRARQQGEPQNGFLRLDDIYNLKLKADLVVISACQTALGKDIKGEGLVGMTRAFMYAGAPRVVASLWRTDDRATSTLMNRSYEGLLTKGLTPASALRNAQIAMWR